MKFEASAPSNIALIKYMGKTQAIGNKPANPSLSYTLKGLQSVVVVELVQSTSSLISSWKKLEGGEPFELSQKGQQRFLKHFNTLCEKYGVSGEFVVHSRNDFPAACGLASSASSFAALTRAFGLMLRELKGTTLNEEVLSQLSQQGSGSSCRSLFPEWSVWEDQGAKGIEFPYQNLIHDAVIVDNKEKKVSSSEAHTRVTTSLNFNGRAERAKMRLNNLTHALRNENWKEAFEICWAEFWDMHSLFETSKPSFGYMTEKSLLALEILKNHWELEEDGPLVTMDAGPNVHLLYRPDQEILKVRLDQKLRSRGLKLWSPVGEA